MEKGFGNRTVCIIFMSLMLSSMFFVLASDTVTAVQDGDYTYTISGSPAVATITKYTGAGGAITIPSTLGGYASVAIGIGAFSLCTSLTSITIPSSVKFIGDQAFYSCTQLTNITIPDNVTSIGIVAFRHCTAMTSIEVAIGNLNYASVDGVLYNKAITNLIECPGGKSGTLIIPNGVTSIEVGAFIFCFSLTSITIPNSVTSIGNLTFSSCTSLTSITIPSSVISIGDNAFSSCTSLTSVILSLPSNLSVIGIYAFDSCTALISISIPIGVTSIGNLAFSRCTAMTSIEVAIGNLNYASVDGVLYNKAITNLIECPGGKSGTITIPDGAISIGDYAFSSCTTLASITIPSSVNSIGDYAFSSCTSLTSIAFYGLDSPGTVGMDWIQDTSVGLRGHAYAASNFPVPGSTFYGLTMGAVISASVTPTSPTNLVVTSGAGFVQLSWTAPIDSGNPSFTRYDIYRGTSSGVYGISISNVAVGTLNYNDTTVTPGTTYFYIVKAVNSAGSSPASNEMTGQSSSPENSGGKNDNTMLYVLIVILFVIIGVLMGYMLGRRKM